MILNAPAAGALTDIPSRSSSCGPDNSAFIRFRIQRVIRSAPSSQASSSGGPPRNAANIEAVINALGQRLGGGLIVAPETPERVRDCCRCTSHPTHYVKRAELRRSYPQGREAGRPSGAGSPPHPMHSLCTRSNTVRPRVNTISTNGANLSWNRRVQAVDVSGACRGFGATRQIYPGRRRPSRANPTQ